MNFKKLVPTVLVGVLALTAIFGVATSQTVQASAATTAAAQATAVPGTTTGPNVKGTDLGRGMKGGVSDTNLAAALGVTVDQLSTARTAANAEAIKQAVAKGLITQAQADAYAAGAGRGLDFRLFSQNGIDENTLLANALGITVEKLTAAAQTAYNTAIDSAVTAGSLTQAQADLMKGQYALSNSTKFQSALQSAYKAAMQQAVTDGTITQAQADAILAANAATPGMGFDLGGRGGMGGGPGGPGGMGGPGGGRGGHGFDGGSGANPAAPTTPQTSPTPGSGA